MEKVHMFRGPVGFELDSLGASKIRGAPAVGDTPHVRTSVRMTSIDPPANHCPVTPSSSNHAIPTQALAGWMNQGSASNKRQLCGLFLLIYLYLFYFMKGGLYEESI